MSLRTCVACKQSINVPDYHTKYCPDCKVKIWERQKVEWKKTHVLYKPKRNLLFCTKCFNKLPAKSNSDRKYCDKCVIVVKKNDKRRLWLRKKEMIICR